MLKLICLGPGPGLAWLLPAQAGGWGLFNKVQGGFLGHCEEALLVSVLLKRLLHHRWAGRALLAALGFPAPALAGLDFLSPPSLLMMGLLT